VANFLYSPTTELRSEKTSIDLAFMIATPPPRSRCASSVTTRGHREFKISAPRVCQPDLPGCPTVWLEEPWACDQDARGLRSRRPHVEPVGAVEELHAVRSVIGRRARHGDDNDGSLLTLEAIDGPDAGAWDPPRDG